MTNRIALTNGKLITPLREIDQRIIWPPVLNKG
jgi:hypothetical protein